MNMKIRCAWCVLILGIGGVFLPASADDQKKQTMTPSSDIAWSTPKGGVQCAIELVGSKPIVPADEPIWIRCHTRKVSTDETRLFSRGLLTYQLSVTDADGKPVSRTRYGTPRPFDRPYRSSGTRSQEWNEGRENAVRIHLNRLYDMSRPGKYTISFSRELGLMDNSATTVESNKLTVEISDTDAFVAETDK